MKKEKYDEATGWFNELYKENRDSYENIPWARLDVNPILAEYLLDNKAESHKKALVIGCGLGDDARAIELAGYDVIAIDISEVALDLAKERFQDSNIEFLEQDIFNMPQKYKNNFDFVFEAFTIQALPREFRSEMIQVISQTLCENAKILVVSYNKEKDFDGPPWPLVREEIDLFKTHKLKELICEIVKEESEISNSKFKAVYQK